MSLLAYPLSQSLLLLLLALLLLLIQWRRAAVISLLCCFSWLYLSSTGLAADTLMATLEGDYPPKAMSVVPPADAIVVLGGATRGDTHFSSLGDLNAQADRLVHAAALYRAGKAPLILLSGGAGPGNRAEADIMEETLELMGIPPRAMLRERASRDTHDNAVYSALQLQERGLERIHLVTSAFHMRRAVPLFERQGLTVIPAPTDYQRLVGSAPVPRWLPTADDLQRSTIAIREHVGFWYYRLRGWL